MENFKYCFTVLDRDSDRIICEDIFDVKELKQHLPEALYEYISSESLSGRLIARRLTQYNRVCLIERCIEYDQSNNQNVMRTPNQSQNPMNG